MIRTSKLVFIAVVAAMSVASPALAQSPLNAKSGVRQSGHSRIATPLGGLHDLAALPRAPLPLDPNDPALTGGGNVGFNRNLSIY
jgi:hypothetical protein